MKDISIENITTNIKKYRGKPSNVPLSRGEAMLISLSYFCAKSNFNTNGLTELFINSTHTKDKL